MSTAEDVVPPAPASGHLRAVRPGDEPPSVGSNRNLNGEANPYGPDVHDATNPVDSFRWLLDELGARGLSGVFSRGSVPVFTAAVDEDGYVPPPPSTDDTPVEKRNDNGPLTISPLSAASLRARLALNYLVWKWVGKGESQFRAETFFPPDAALLAMEAIDKAVNIRPLLGVTHTPMVRADATILTEPGYDDLSGFLFIPTVDVPPVPENPTTAELKAATVLLRGLVDEFMWSGEHDEANFMGLLLTPVLRQVCPPPYKLGAIMARQPGSGKSLLNRILRDVHGGVFRSEMPHDDAELEKAISSILTCTTAPIVQFDNVSGTLRSSRLAGLLTSAEYSGRVLGSTNETSMTNDRLWTITGNNLNLGGDLVRRTLWVTIDPKCPDPEKRTGFKLDIPVYVAEHRGEILHALLTWVSAWRVSGRPVPALRSSDDYAHWVRTVAGIITHAGVPGTFCHDDSGQQKLGTDDEGWGEFLEAIQEVMGDKPWTTRDLTARMTFGAGARDIEALVDSLPGELHDLYHRAGSGSGGASAIKQKLGIWIKNRNGRWAGNLVCEKVGENRTAKTSLWKVRSATETASPDGHPW